MAVTSSVGFSGNEDEVDLEFLRTRLRKITIYYQAKVVSAYAILTCMLNTPLGAML